MFTRSGMTWTQQGVKLFGTDAVGDGDSDQQGSSVALSGDGNTALVGGPGDHRGAGAAWAFVTQLPPGTKITKAKLSSKHH